MIRLQLHHTTQIISAVSKTSWIRSSFLIANETISYRAVSVDCPLLEIHQTQLYFTLTAKKLCLLYIPCSSDHLRYSWTAAWLSSFRILFFFITATKFNEKCFPLQFSSHLRAQWLLQGALIRLHVFCLSPVLIRTSFSHTICLKLCSPSGSEGESSPEAAQARPEANQKFASFTVSKRSKIFIHGIWWRLGSILYVHLIVTRNKLACDLHKYSEWQKNFDI